MSASSQATSNEQIRQQHLLLYLNSVLLDFDNHEELLKLKSKVKRAQLRLQGKTKEK